MNNFPLIRFGMHPGSRNDHEGLETAADEAGGAGRPVVRCLLHDPVVNLSIGGKVYESRVYWELNFTNVAKLEDFYPH